MFKNVVVVNRRLSLFLVLRSEDTRLPFFRRHGVTLVSETASPCDENMVDGPEIHLRLLSFFSAERWVWKAEFYDLQNNV